MSASLNIVAPDTPLERMGETIAEHGYLIIEHAAPELTGRALEELRPHIESAPFGHTDFLGAKTKRLGGLFRRSKAAQELVIQPPVLGLADRVLLPHCARYQLNFSGIMHLEPGARPQVLHRDGILYPFLHPHPPTLMPAMWALTDFTAANGGTQVVPGSHLWENDRKPFDDEVLNAEMPAGSVLIYTGGILHGGGDNRSGTVRTGMALQYSLGWLRQEENQYLANPPEIARTYPERLQRLIGYDYGAPYMGFVDGGDNRSGTVRTGMALQYSLGWLRQEENQYLANPPEIAKTFPERLQRLIGYDYGAPYMGFVNGGDPHRVLEDDVSGPANRTTPELDAAAERVEWLNWGTMTPVPTPVREGRHAPTVSRNPDAA